MKTQSLMLCLAMTLSCLASDAETPNTTTQMLTALPAELSDYTNLLKYPLIDKRGYPKFKTDEGHDLYVWYSKKDNFLKIESRTDLENRLHIPASKLKHAQLTLIKFNEEEHNQKTNDQYTKCKSYLIKEGKNSDSHIFSTQCTTLLDLKNREVQTMLDGIIAIKKAQQK